MAFGDVVQSNTGTSTTATTSPTLPSGVTAGNLVVLSFAADDYNGTPNAGWTQSTGMEQQSYHGGYTWWFIATSNGQAIPSYTVGSAVRSNWNLAEYEGPFDAAPYDTSNGQKQEASAITYTTPAITPTAGDRLLIANVNFQQSSADIAAGGDWTNSFTQVTSTVYNGANPRLAVGQAKRVVTADGSTSYSTGATMATSQVAGSESGLIIAFKAGAAGSTDGTVVATVATASAAAVAPAVTGTAATTDGTVTAVAATASAEGLAPAVIGQKVVSGGGPAAATATAIAPTVTATKSVTVEAVAAVATATAVAPSINGVLSPTVSAAVAAATAAAVAPTVTGTAAGDGLVLAVPARATARGYAPTLTPAPTQEAIHMPEELQSALNRVAGTTGLEAQGAANAWAETEGLELLGALNAKNGTTGMGLLAVLNELAGTTGLDVNGAAGALT